MLSSIAAVGTFVKICRQTGGIMHKPTMLVILDGFGHGNVGQGNAIRKANMPFWHSTCHNYRTALLKAAGADVGLLPGTVGNSEVGHITMGAGRIILSDLVRFDQLLASEHDQQRSTLIAQFKQLQQTHGQLHLMGLLSNGGVHSHERHLYELIELAKMCGITQIFIHAFLDGRDVPPTSAAQYLQRLTTVPGVTLASVQGRFYAMDRDNNLERTGIAYKALTGNIPVLTDSWQQVLDRSYKHGVTDEFVVPTLLNANGGIKAGDGVIFFNVRPDRARQLAELFINPEKRLLTLAFFTTPTLFDKRFATWGKNNTILLQQTDVQQTLLDILAAEKKEVFVVAETEKYAHVTYFFQGFHEAPFDHQKRVMIPSMKVRNYIQQPEMSAAQITTTLIKSLRTQPADFYLVNLANADMVGHSGNLPATIKACEFLDQQLALICHEVVDRLDGTVFITGDHGKAEAMLDEQSIAITAHTTNPVPFVAVGKQYKVKKMQEFDDETREGLSSIAPTILNHLGLPVPSVMEKSISSVLC